MQRSFYPKYLPRLDGDAAIGRAIRAGRCFAPSLAMQLVADRFAVHDDGRAFDLATGARVTLMVGSAGGVSEQLRWSERCGMLRALRHRAMAPLVDFGLVGQSSRFEAWAAGSIRRRDEGQAVHASAARWLRACGLSAGPLSADAVRIAGDGSRVWVPDAGTGYPADTEGEPGEMPIADRGLEIVEQPVVSTLAEMFGAAGGTRPYVSALWGPPGAGKRAVILELARIARTKGFVPVAAPLIGSRQAPLWSGRSLFVIADAADQSVWPAFVNVALSDPQPHVLLVAGKDECRSVGGIRVRRLAVDALVAAIRPQALRGRADRTVRRAAERAQGWPGRFTRLLWPSWDGDARASAACGSRLPRVAEQPAVYGADDAGENPFEPATSPCAWPAPGELAALRRRMDHAIADLGRGRHAPAIRQLRQVVGGLARRGAWSDAANGALAISRALLKRGRTREAQVAVDEGREYAMRADEKTVLVDFAILAGAAWIDMGRLDEADSVLGAAAAAARALGDPARAAAASVALARGSYWRGRYAEAEAILGAASDVPAMRVRRALLASRIAVGLGDLNRAMSLVTVVAEPVPLASGSLVPPKRGSEGGCRTAEAHDVAANAAAVACVTAFIHLAVGDLNAAERDVAQALALARAARDPQRAARARLLRAEVERARERPAAALAQLQRLRRVARAASGTVRARWEVAIALSAPGADAREVVAKHVRGTGLGALALYVAAPRTSRCLDVCRVGSFGPAAVGVPFGSAMAACAADPFVDELVAILRVCQTAADEIDLLKDVCTRLRQHLHAAAVAFVAVHGQRAHVVISDGARLDTHIAERVASAGIAIAPHRCDDRMEAAAPIEYGGSPIGALCARWTIGSTYDTSRAGSVLAMSAAAAAPMLAAVLARQRRVDSGPGDLLGIAPVVAELRQSVERAAAAPFSVLIDGESGSGKELVARAIHRGSPRRHKPFCTLNCAALPDDLVEAELFGHTRGAFTGAVADRAGVFEEAHGGTLFLDEVGELTPRAQAKLLRVIQDGELRRVGENVSRRVDVRIVSATNRALRREVEGGTFRLDLLYRLDVVHITVPPLRERREDVAVLAEHFWRDAATRVNSRATLGAATVAALARYDWPGNVRELQNVLAALAVRTPKRGVVPSSALPPLFAGSSQGEAWTLDEARRTFELRFVRAALVRTGGHRGRAAAELGVTRQGLTKLMTRLGIAP